MSLVRNADEFLLEYRRIWEKYETLFAPRIAKIRAMYVGESEEGFLEQCLEAHIRSYVVNALLAALNWRLDQNPEDGLPNLIPEVPVRSTLSGTIRFLDYLGLERNTDNPLMIIETKRPSSELPHTLEQAENYSEILSRGLAGAPLSGDWNTWLDNLRDYLRSTQARAQKVPKRIVITNGDWLIIFLNPSGSFLESGNHDLTHILVFENHSDIDNRYCLLFLNLERLQISGETPSLNPGELSFYVDGKVVDQVMFGIRIHYIEQYGIYRYSPVIKLAPIVFIHSRYGGWLRVERPPREHELPHKNDQLLQHLDEFERAAIDLLAEINSRLTTSLQPICLAKHYEEKNDPLCGVTEYKANEYIVVTGDKTHYLLQKSSISFCPYHDWNDCNRDGFVSTQEHIVVRSTSPRSFFISKEIHHCAHSDVKYAKSTPITFANRPRCGPRIGPNGQAFCQIWRFEQYLCCRACVFEEICTKASVFRLPCYSRLAASVSQKKGKKPNTNRRHKECN
jgi:hypothetical protein